MMIKSIFIGILVYMTAGGIYFGQYSCGGFVWKEKLFENFGAGLIVIYLLISIWKKKLNIKIIFSIILFPVVFLLVRSVSAAFYPKSPESIIEFLKSFKLALLTGPC